MKLKNILKKTVLVSAAVMAAMAASCTDEIKFGDSFIEKAPEDGTLPADSVFASPAYTKQYLNGIYGLQYYGLPYNNGSYVNWSHNPYRGKLDGFTDCYSLHWGATTLYAAYYGGTLTAAQNPLFSYDGDKTWIAVNRVWTLLERIDECRGLDENLKKRYIAEAKCILAARYFDMFILFGGLPIVEKSYGATESFKFPRNTVEETVDFMVKTLDEAIPDLRWAWDGTSSDENDTQTGRWTKAGAMALKAKILTFAASPLFNCEEPYYDGTTEAEKQKIVWYGDYQVARWERAKKACEEFFSAVAENGFYALEWPEQETPNHARLAYRKGYRYTTSHETLHSNRVRSYDNWANGNYSWGNWVNIGRNSYLPTVEYMEMFPWSDGKSFNWKADSTSIFGGANKITGKYKPGKLFFEYVDGKKTASRDPRLYEEILVNGMDATLDWTSAAVSGDEYELWVGGFHEGNQVASVKTDKNTGKNTITVLESMTAKYSTGFGVVKYQLTGEDDLRLPCHWQYLGLSEMYLMYAECLAQTGDLEGAIDQVQVLRNRVLMPKTLADAVPACKTDKDVLIDEILRERACELGMSNNRYYDMMRYKKGEWMTKKLHGLITLRMKQQGADYVITTTPYIGDEKNADEDGKGRPTVFTYQKFVLQQPAQGRAQWAFQPTDKEIKKWFLQPMPLWEIQKNYGLIQNPGWE